MNMAKKVNHRMRTPADYDYVDHVEAVIGRTIKLRTALLAIILGLLCFLVVLSVSSDAWGWSIHEPGSHAWQAEQNHQRMLMEQQARDLEYRQWETERQMRKIQRIQREMKWQLDCREMGIKC